MARYEVRRYGKKSWILYDTERETRLGSAVRDANVHRLHAHARELNQGAADLAAALRRREAERRNVEACFLPK